MGLSVRPSLQALQHSLRTKAFPRAMWALKTIRVSRILAKKVKQNWCIPQLIRVITGNMIRYNANGRHWRRTKPGWIEPGIFFKAWAQAQLKTGCTSEPEPQFLQNLSQARIYHLLLPEPSLARVIILSSNRAEPGQLKLFSLSWPELSRAFYTLPWVNITKIIEHGLR